MPSSCRVQIVSEIKHLIPVEVMCGADEATLLSLVSSKLVWLREQTFFSHQLEVNTHLVFCHIYGVDTLLSVIASRTVGSAKGCFSRVSPNVLAGVSLPTVDP